MSRKLLRGGLSLAVDDAGGAGKPVIFQHGLGGDARQTEEALPSHPALRRITLECRGHGRSPAGAASIALFAEDVAALVESLPRPVALGGISMGAAIALRLAVTRPGMVAALVLVRPAWIAGPAPPNMAPVAEVAALLARLPADEARVAFASSEMARRLAAEAPDNLASLDGYFDREPREETARLLAAIAADGPGITEDQIAALRLPTLVCGSEEDAIHPMPVAERLAALIPGAWLVRLPPKGRDRAAHFAALHAAISAFLRES